MSVSLETEPFRSGNPVSLLDQPFLTSGPFGPIFDVSHDGQRFLKIKEDLAGGASEPAEVILVQNWTEELKRLVPVDH